MWILNKSKKNYPTETIASNPSPTSTTVVHPIFLIVPTNDVQSVINNIQQSLSSSNSADIAIQTIAPSTSQNPIMTASSQQTTSTYYPNHHMGGYYDQVGYEHQGYHQTQVPQTRSFGTTTLEDVPTRHMGTSMDQEDYFNMMIRDTETQTTFRLLFISRCSILHCYRDLRQNLTTMENRTISLYEKCFDPEKLLLMSYIEKPINQYVFPIQFMITVVGNLLTMTVLLSGHIKNRANHLLTSLALCDMFVFFMMIPHYLASLDWFSESVQFRIFHYHSKVHFGALSNWFSAAAIWFVLAVSLERLLIIKFPFRSLDAYNAKQVGFVSVGIMLATLLLTSYHHISHTCLSHVVCQGTQVIGTCFSNLMDSFTARTPNPTPEMTKYYIRTSVFANAIFAVLLPIFAVAVLNISLIRLVKQRRSEELLVRNAPSGPSTMAEQEKKMTNTVLAIVSCFTLTQGPSAIVYIFDGFFPPISNIIANQLVLTGKMLNIVLFCLSSETFRRRLWFTCRFWCSMIFYAGRRNTKMARAEFFNRSRSNYTQKTSLVYSPCSRNFSTSRKVSNSSINGSKPNLPLISIPTPDSFPTPPASSNRSIIRNTVV
ncbi:unnamed protein product [Caenorhabditis angaria]|uniref:G-protein coupled receptors family 1 profile domain-containing protein n=1 Tax=Caenorhabditis angaria TaxID=860376 RepID=A0A9P1IPH7_9PELO|nr:unnamed protein product [Caenorhabditis angaria]